MYASPVVYTTSTIPQRFYGLFMCNPMAPLLTTWRYAILGIGEFPAGYWALSWCVTAAVLLLGVVLFSHIEKTFMDTV